MLCSTAPKSARPPPRPALLTEHSAGQLSSIWRLAGDADALPHPGLLNQKFWARARVPCALRSLQMTEPCWRLRATPWSSGPSGAWATSRPAPAGPTLTSSQLRVRSRPRCAHRAARAQLGHPALGLSGFRLSPGPSFCSSSRGHPCSRAGSGRAATHPTRAPTVAQPAPPCALPGSAGSALPRGPHAIPWDPAGRSGLSTVAWVSPTLSAICVPSPQTCGQKNSITHFIYLGQRRKWPYNESYRPTRSPAHTWGLISPAPLQTPRTPSF